ncbi:hypothetical protein Acor_14820 [Acrocarpospora corrugata]|uniref:Xylose isomerase-like TIM barrel domain-containing protein n=1 Tax=Acrocarpospora corrugata TaxID=35763 RepID=A0A5M3VT70_9ACTN|nr:sugar phosphate isomerase/epimerase [Acrocarpospora corrugata]GER99418.1 hypothetical protein Acor_14820 [Acrocarpospora corrugata]
MRLGLFTGCLPRLSLEAIAEWSARQGYDALEVAAWPTAATEAGYAAHIDVAGMTGDEIARVRGVLTRNGLTLSAISYYANNLHGDDAERERIHRHLLACVDAAAALEVPCVGTFVGRDASRSVADNLARAQRHLPPLVEYAAARGIRLVIENCPMESWHPDGYPGNLAYSPELWDWLSGLGLYLNFDPSHLVWLGIDPIDALRPRLERGQVLHVQAKDIEIDDRARTRYGFFGKTVGRQAPEDVGWWRYRVPGRGLLDWNRLVDTLYAGGFDGVVAVEHEDPVWGGSEERIKQGLQIAAGTLRPLIL